MKYRIRLDTMSDVNKFVKIATAYPGKIMLTDGENFKKLVDDKIEVRLIVQD